MGSTSERSNLYRCNRDNRLGVPIGALTCSHVVTTTAHGHVPFILERPNVAGRLRLYCARRTTADIDVSAPAWRQASVADTYTMLSMNAGAGWTRENASLLRVSVCLKRSLLCAFVIVPQCIQTTIAATKPTRRRLKAGETTVSPRRRRKILQTEKRKA